MEANIIGHTKALSATLSNADMDEEKRRLAIIGLQQLAEDFGMKLSLSSYDKPVYENEDRYYLFYYRYGGFYGNPYDELKEAQDAAENISVEGTGSPVCIYDTKTNTIIDDLNGFYNDEKDKILTRINQYLQNQRQSF